MLVLAKVQLTQGEALGLFLVGLSYLPFILPLYIDTAVVIDIFEYMDLYRIGSVLLNLSIVADFKNMFTIGTIFAKLKKTTTVEKVL